ncbi:MAG: hypothetical protein U0174_00125 [Polyangiaceae bacterium]
MRFLPRKNRTPHFVLKSLCLAALAGTGVIAACSSNYVATEQKSDASVVKPNTADASSPARVCGENQKLCAGTCVGLDDPRYGCAAESCDPCALTNTKTHTCDAAGKCSVEQCAAGWDYCYLDKGCTIDPLSPDTCGGCAVRGGKNCSPSEVCSEGSCKNQCDPVAEKTITNCNRSCVDLSSHPRHCGACTTECLPTPGGSAACIASKCAIDCDENHGHCKNDLTTCESLLPLYLDKDGDSWGSAPVLNGAKQKFACAAGAGEAVRGGDCLDEPTNAASKDVFPTQTRFFTAAYTVGGVSSFDYNCNGKTDLNAPTGGSCSGVCVRGFIGKVICGNTASYSTCGELPAEEQQAQAIAITTVPGGGSSGVPACPVSAIVSCH